jgi:hypothetical protein
MNWLSKHKALIDCAKRSIKLSTPNGKEMEFRCDILSQGLIGLIEYSYHQGIPSFLEAHLQRTLGLSVLGMDQF